MLTKEHIEKILHLNGVEPAAGDDQVKAVLLRARWNQADVDAALLVLRTDTTSGERHHNDAERLFHSDGRLSPEMVSSLLGLDLSVQLKDVPLDLNKTAQLRIDGVVLIILVALCVAVATLTVGMWFFEVGPFHAARW